MKIRFSQINIEETKRSIQSIIKSNMFVFPYYMFISYLFIIWIIWAIKYI